MQGKMECVGAPMDLKARVCGGYVVEARLPRDQHTAFVSGMRDTFPSAALRVTEQPWSDIIVLTVSETSLDVPRCGALFLFDSVLPPGSCTETGPKIQARQKPARSTPCYST